MKGKNMERNKGLMNKFYVWLLIGLMFGMILFGGIGSSQNMVVGMNHWTHDKDNNFLVPTNTSVNVSLNNNSLIYSNLSGFAGDNVSWDPVAMAFDVTGAGFGLWNLADGVLYTRVDGNDVQVNGTINGTDGEFSDDVSIGDRLDVGGDIVVVDDIFGDVVYVRTIGIEDSIYHRDDPDTFWHFNTDELYFTIDGFQVLKLLNETSTFYNNVIMNRNLTVSDTVTADSFVGDGSGLTNVNASNITGGVWNRVDGILYTGVDGDIVYLNNSLNMSGTNRVYFGTGFNNYIYHNSAGDGRLLIFGDDEVNIVATDEVDIDAGQYIEMDTGAGFPFNLGTANNPAGGTGLISFETGDSVGDSSGEISFETGGGDGAGKQSGDVRFTVGQIINGASFGVMRFENALSSFYKSIGGSEPAWSLVDGGGDVGIANDLEVQGNTSLAGYLNVTDNINANTSDAYFANIFGNGAGLTGIEIDISDDTNLTATSPLVLTDDDLSFDLSVSNIFTARQDITLSAGVGFPAPPGDLLMRLRNDGTSTNDAWIQLLSGGTGQVGVSFSGGDSESIYYDRNLGAMNIKVNDEFKYQSTPTGGTKIVKTGTPVASEYALSVQDDGVYTYIEILNGAGTGKGAFFGMQGSGADGDAFDLYNYQGGPIDFYTAPTASASYKRMSIQSDGLINIARRGYISWYDINTSIQGKGDGPGDEFLTLRSGGNINIIPNENFSTTVTGNLTVTKNITGNVHHGEAYFHNHDGDTLTFVSDIWYNLSFNASKNLNGFTWDGLGNLTCLVSGLYDVGFVACGSGQNNHIYNLAVGINGIVDVNVSAHKKMAAGGDETDMGGSGFIQLTAGDYVSLMIRDHGGSGTGKYIHSNLNLVRIGN